MKRIILIMIIGIILLMSGCQSEQMSDSNGQSGSSELQKTSVNDVKKDEIVLYLGALAEPDMGFDPILGWANVDGVSLFHSTLVTQDNNMEIIGELAESFEVSEDKKSYIFKLKDAKFSDGTAITSKDVAFTFEEAAKSGYVGNLDKISSIDTSDDKIVIINLSEPNSLFIYAVVRLGIVPKDSYGEAYGDNPVSSGPYILKQWDKGQQLIAEINPHYFGEQPAIKKTTILFLSEEAAFEAAKQGEFDLFNVPAVYTSQDIPNMDLVHYKSVDVQNIGWSVRRKDEVKRDDGLSVGNDITADIAIRKALNIGIDRQAIVDGILGGYGSPAYDLVDPDMPWYNPETSYKDNDVEGAKKILAAAGWVDTDGDGIVEKNGVKAEVPLLVAADNSKFQGMAMAISEMAKQFGIFVNVESVSWEVITPLIYTKPYILTWGSKDPINIFYLFDSNNSGLGWYNSGYYKNDKVDEYIKNALQSSSQSEAHEYWKKAQWDGETGFSTLGDAPWFWLVRLEHVYRINPKLNVGEQGLQNPSMGWALLHNIEEWNWHE